MYEIDKKNHHTLLDTVTYTGEEPCITIQNVQSEGQLQIQLSMDGKTYQTHFKPKPNQQVHYFYCYSDHYDSKGNFYAGSCVGYCKDVDDKADEFKIIGLLDRFDVLQKRYENETSDR